MGGGMEEVGGGMKTVSLGGASGHVPGLEGGAGRGGKEPALQVSWGRRSLGWEQQLLRPWDTIREAAVLGEHVKRILIPLAGFDLCFKRVTLL